MSLGERLKMEREKRNWSQKYVAEKIGITNTVLSNYERDYRDPDTETLRKLAELYDVPTDYLLGRTDKPTNKSLTTEKDEKDIAKRLQNFKEEIENADGLAFSGEPLSDEAKESLLEAMEYVFRQTQRINKKYIPKKYRKD